MTKTPEKSELGKKSTYASQYDPEQLFPIPRKLNRDKIGLPEKLPFFGWDVWNHYEVSWLDNNGKPVVAVAEIVYGCESEHIIESKSMKLYFNSFNNTKINDVKALEALITEDIASRIHAPVSIKITLLRDFNNETLFSGFKAICIDDLPITCDEYMLNPAFLKTEDDITHEAISSNLLKSNCLVTNQPDWGSVLIEYRGKKIDHAGLLKYIVSFRNCNEFSETSIERIFNDISTHCHPEFLLVYGRFTRRGGLDINVMRSSEKNTPNGWNYRLCRQ